MEDNDRWQALKDSTEHQRKKLADKNKNLEFYLKSKKLTSEESALLFAEIDRNEHKIKDLEKTLLECDENLIFWSGRDYRRRNILPRDLTWTPSSTDDEWENTPRSARHSDIDTYSRRRSRQSVDQIKHLDDDISVKKETLNALEEKIEKCSSDIIKKRKEIDDLTAESKIVGAELKRKKSELKTVKEEVDRYREAVLREKSRVAKLETKKDELNSQIENLKKSLKENNLPQRSAENERENKDLKDEFNVSAYQMKSQRNEKADLNEKRIQEYENLFAGKEDQIAALVAEMEILRSQNQKLENQAHQAPAIHIGTKQGLEIHGEDQRTLQQKLKNSEADMVPDLQKRNADLAFSIGQLEKENDRLLSLNQDLMSKIEKSERLKISQKWSDKVSKTKKTDPSERKQKRDKVNVEDFIDSDRGKRPTVVQGDSKEMSVSAMRGEELKGTYDSKKRESTLLTDYETESLSKQNVVDESSRTHVNQLRQDMVVEGNPDFDPSLPDGVSIRKENVPQYPLNVSGIGHIKHGTLQRSPMGTDNAVYSPRESPRHGPSEQPIVEEPEIRTGEYEGIVEEHDNEGTSAFENESEYESYVDSHRKKKYKFSKTEIKYKKTMQVKDKFKSKPRKLSDSKDMNKEDFDKMKRMDQRTQPEESVHYKRDVHEFFDQNSGGGSTSNTEHSSHQERRHTTGSNYTKETHEEGFSLRKQPPLSQNEFSNQEERQNNMEQSKGDNAGNPNLRQETTTKTNEELEDKDIQSINTGENENDKRVRFHDDNANIRGGMDETDGAPVPIANTVNLQEMDEEELRKAVQELSAENMRLEKDLEKATLMLKESEQKLIEAHSELSALKSKVPGVNSTDTPVGMKTDGLDTQRNEMHDNQTQNSNEAEVKIQNEPLHSGPNMGRSAAADSYIESEVKSEHLQSAFAPRGMGSHSGDNAFALRDLQRELEARDRRIEELEESKRDIKRERDTFKNKYLRYEKKDERKLEDKYDDISDLHKKVSSVERKAHRKETDIYKDNLKLERDLDLANTKLSEAEKEVKRLKKESKQSETEKEKELKTLRETVPNLEREKDELTQRLERLERGGVEVPENSSRMRSVPEKAQKDPDTGAVDKNKKEKFDEEKKESVGFLGKLRGLSRKGEKKGSVKEESKDDMDLHAENTKLKEELAQLSELVPRLEKERDTLKEKLERLKPVHQDADGENKNKYSMKGDGTLFDEKEDKKETGDQKEGKSKLQERIEYLERQLAMVKGSAPDVMSENQHLKEQLRKSKAEIHKLKQSNEENYAETGDGTFQQNRIADSADPFQPKPIQRIRDYELELQGLREENDLEASESDREFSRSRKSKKSSKTNAAIFRLEKERDELRKELESAKSRLSDLEEQLKDSQNIKYDTKFNKEKLTNQDFEHSETRSKEQLSKSKLPSVRGADDNSDEENQRLKGELTQSKIEIEALMERVRENEEQIETLQIENHRISTEKRQGITSPPVEDPATTEDQKRIRDELERSKEQITELEDQIEILQKERDRALAEKERAFARLKESENNLRLYINKIDTMKKERVKEIASQKEALQRQKKGAEASEKLVEELQEKLNIVTSELEETQKRLEYSEGAMRCHYTRKK